jgi:hypothetical protein
MNDTVLENEKMLTGNYRFRVRQSILALAAFSCPAALLAAEGSADERPGTQSLWSPFARGGYVHQFDSNLDGGGKFDVDRFFLQGGLSYSIGPRRRISLSVGAGRDRYDFSGNPGFVDEPWDRIDQLRFGVPVTWAFDEQWTLFAIPTLRFYGESGADSGDSATGGALAGVSYRVNDRLTIGPGLGVLSQIEDSVSVFPILIVDWKITDRVSLETGRGLGATQGPGLNLNYRLSDTWSFGLGGRYESLRFRLDDRGSAPDGVGEDRSVPVYLSATYSRDRDLQISAIGGIELNGELRLEDSQGRRLARDNYETAPFLGATFNVRF